MDYRIINHPKRPFIHFFSNMKTREPFNTWSHVFGAFASLFFIYLFFTHAQDRSPAGILALLIYGFSTLAMFSSSAIYHGFNGNDLQIKRLRMIDHMMIYVVIAGGYTPIAALVLPDNMGKYVLYGIWIIAGLGVLKKKHMDDRPFMVFYFALRANGLGFCSHFSSYLERNNSFI